MKYLLFKQVILNSSEEVLSVDFHIPPTINSTEDLWKHILKSKDSHFLWKISVVKYFLNKICSLGQLEKTNSIEIDEKLFNLLCFIATHAIESYLFIFFII